MKKRDKKVIPTDRLHNMCGTHGAHCIKCSHCAHCEVDSSHPRLDLFNVSNVVHVANSLDLIKFEKAKYSALLANFNYLKEQAKKGIIYGINTGLGPMSHIFIGESAQVKLQYNLIRSHAVGQGERMSKEECRAIMFIRLQTLSRGFSGIHPDTCKLLVEFLNRDIVPVIFRHGSVGASGDLVQLSHIAESLIGEGQVYYKNKIVQTKNVLRSEGLSPLKIHVREGLALINGTAAMTGIGALNVHKSKVLLEYSILASACLYEIVGSSDDYFSDLLSVVRPQYGQCQVSSLLREILKDSGRICKESDVEISDVIKNPLDETYKLDTGRQEIYSIRCAPQVLGPIFETIENAEKVVNIEINSVTDNPIIETGGKIIHGGNFHGDYVSLEMDKLKISITKLSMLSERKLNFLLNDRVNKILTPFLNLATPGLDLGLQGLQFVATSTVAENQSLSMPVSIHSIPNNNDNQDIVSMGTNSATIAGKIIDNTFEVLAIELIAIARAVKILDIQNKMSARTRAVYQEISSCIKGKGDLILRSDVLNVITMLKGK